MRKLAFLIGFVVLLLPSCTTLQIVSFDRLQAAGVNFPEQIRSVGIVDAMPVVKQDVDGQKRSSGLLEGDGKVATETLAQEIAATGYFERVVICDSNIWKNPVPMENPLSATLVDSLTKALEVDMLFVMERVRLELSDGVVVSQLMGPVPAVDGIVTPLLRTYVPGRNAPIFAYGKSDTLCWEKTPTLTFGQIVKEASDYAGAMPMRTLLPYWTEAQRYYFDGGSVEMRDAGVCVREHDWEGATALWQQVYERSKKKKKAYAAFNLALSCEMQDDFERSRQYLDEASRIFGEDSPEAVLIKFYRGQLEEQAGDNQRLRIQMKRFER